MNPEMESTYGERSFAMSASSRRAACEDAARHFQRGRAAHENMGSCLMVLLNEMRLAGNSFHLACGREQLLFTVEGAEFCRQHLLPYLPPEMRLEDIRACVHIANKVPAPIQTVAEAKLVERQLQEEFVLLGLLPSSARKKLHTAHARNLFSDFVNRVSGIPRLVEEMEQDEDIGPMDQWSPQVLDEFLEAVQPTKDKIACAERLRLGLKTG